MCHAFCDGPRYVSSCWDHAMSDCWDHAMLRSGCVGAVLCGEADEEALWLASLWRLCVVVLVGELCGFWWLGFVVCG